MFDLNTHFTFQVHSGGHGGGFADQLGHFLKNLENLLAKDSGEILNILFPGIHGMDNIHPLFVHFPIALLFGFLCIELVAALFNKQAWRTVASFFLYLGTLSALVTVFFGLEAAKTVAHTEAVHEIMVQHQYYGITVAVLSVVLSFWRWFVRASFGVIGSTLHILLAFITCFILFLGADLGGLMVYQYGVGVGAAEKPTHIHHRSHSHSHGHSHNHDH